MSYFFAGVPCVTPAITPLLFAFLLRKLHVPEIPFIQLASQRSEDIFSSLYNNLLQTYFTYTACLFSASGRNFPFQVNRIVKSDLLMCHGDWTLPASAPLPLPFQVNKLNNIKNRQEFPSRTEAADSELPLGIGKTLEILSVGTIVLQCPYLLWNRDLIYQETCFDHACLLFPHSYSLSSPTHPQDNQRLVWAVVRSCVRNHIYSII